ncbi:tetratricopeptide repeat protein [Winogradskyella sp.]|uniref:tetratricopeptide repeat protein n=1 Tax=Winogradskyella sp. TaxID=1883156 RepID=UPI003BAC1017
MNYSIAILVVLNGCLFLQSQNSKRLGDELYAVGNYSKAIELYKTVEDLDSVYDEIAKAYLAIGNYGEALFYYEKALKADPDNGLISYEYAKLLVRTKKYDKAKLLFNNLVSRDSINPNYHYELGVVLEKLNDSTAFEAFKKTYNLDQTHQKAIFKMAKRHIFKRRFKEAHNIIDIGLESYAENVDLISLKAQAYYFQDYHTHSVVWFNKLLDLDETSEFIHEKLSISYAQNSDYQDAIYHRKEALKFNPSDANAMYVIGAYYQRLGDFEKAEEYMSKALNILDVSLSHEYQQLGSVLNRQKKYDEAIKAFQKSLKEDPSNISSEFFILRTKDAYYADLDTKIKLYENFIKNKPDSPFKVYAEQRLKLLKEEKFIEEN